jgi:hypothetical protein
MLGQVVLKNGGVLCGKLPFSCRRRLQRLSKVRTSRLSLLEVVARSERQRGAPPADRWAGGEPVLSDGG